MNVSKTAIVLERGEINKEMQKMTIFGSPHKKSKESYCSEFEMICDQSFVLEETPAVILLKEALESRSSFRRLRLYYATRKAQKFCLIYQLVTVSLGLVASLIKHFVQWDRQMWEDLTLLRPVYHAIPLMFLSAVFIIAFLDAVGLANILALFESLEKNLPDHFDTPDDLRWFEGNEVLEKKTKNADFRIRSTIKVFPYLQQVLLGTNNAWQNLRGLPERLGSVTVVCTVATAGVITDNVDYIEKICFFSGDKPTILELSRDPTPKGEKRMKFHDIDLKEECSTNLMPMVINSAMNSHCLSSIHHSSPLYRPLDPLVSHIFPCNHKSRNICLCQLAMELDFGDNLISDFVPFFTINQFAHGTQLLNSFPQFFGITPDNDDLVSSSSSTPLNSVPSSPLVLSDPDVEPLSPANKVSRMATRMRKRNTRKLLLNQHADRVYQTNTIVVQDPSQEAVQLFANGDLPLLIKNCSFVWDGMQVRPFTEEDILRLLELESQWSAYNCIAFSYVPLAPHFLPFFNRFTLNRSHSSRLSALSSSPSSSSPSTPILSISSPSPPPSPSPSKTSRSSSLLVSPSSPSSSSAAINNEVYNMYSRGLKR